MVHLPIWSIIEYIVSRNYQLTLTFISVCTPSVNLTFQGNFEDSSPYHQPVEVSQASVTNTGSAYFNGRGYLTMPTLADTDFGASLVIKLRYRRKPSPGQPGKHVSTGSRVVNIWHRNWVRLAPNGTNLAQDQIQYILTRRAKMY